MSKYTKLKVSEANFNDAMTLNGFGIVTIMDAEIYEIPEGMPISKSTPYQIVKTLYETTPICTLDTLKIANVTQEGPAKTVTGGQFSNPLIKFGKSARLEMQDALGNAKAIEALCGGFQEFEETTSSNPEDSSLLTALHFGEDFSGPKTIIGNTFVIDRKTGQQIPVKIIFYQFLPDSIFNLTQDAEGDATVFDMNGDLLTTVVTVDKNIEKGVFYSILDPVHLEKIDAIPSGSVRLNANSGVFKNGEQSQKLRRQYVINKSAYTVPTRDKYDFTDWYYDEAGTEPVIDGVKVESEAELYAGWTVKTEKVQWQSSGGGTANLNEETLLLSSTITFDPSYVAGGLKVSGQVKIKVGSHALAVAGASVMATNLYWSKEEDAEFKDWKPLLSADKTETFLNELGTPLYLKVYIKGYTIQQQDMYNPVTITYKKAMV